MRAVGRLELEGFRVVSDLPLTKHYAISTLLLASRVYRATGRISQLACLADVRLRLACAGQASAERRLVGLSRFELLTPRLSSVCSNQLSYRPDMLTVKEP